MINGNEKQMCSGCGSCASVCPQKCIEMKQDGEGFGYPIVNIAECVDCHLCEKACPILNPVEKKGLPQAYACINLEESVRAKSSSGGVFTLLAEWILERGGVVFGAAFDENWNVIHIAVEDKAKLWRLRGAKYTQSRMGSCYDRARKFLQQGRMVYFSGTPCQIDGLFAFLQTSHVDEGMYDNLFCQDIICHGVPSPRLWQRYLHSLQLGETVEEINFREKKVSWKNYRVSFSGNQKTLVEPFMSNPYMKLFVENLSLRPSCYSCKSKGIARRSDLTLGDFWGVEKVLPGMDDDKGTSLVMVHSQKGAELFGEIQEKMKYCPVDVKQAVAANPSAEYPPKRIGRRELLGGVITADTGNGDFEKGINRMLTKNPYERAKEFIWKLTIGRGN